MRAGTVDGWVIICPDPAYRDTCVFYKSKAEAEFMAERDYLPYAARDRVSVVPATLTIHHQEGE